MRKLVVSAVLVLAALVGLPDLAVSVPRSETEPSPIDLHPCRNVPGAECGSIELPLDPRDPDLGATTVGFLRYPRRRQDLPSLGTIVAVEGGPGYSTIASRWWYANTDRHPRRCVSDRQRRRVVAGHEPRDRGRLPRHVRA